MDDRITTLHPDGKHGTNIERAKYNTIRSAIHTVLSERGEITFTELVDAVQKKLGATFAGSIPWYVTTIKLDLEARGEIERILDARPQRLRQILH